MIEALRAMSPQLGMIQLIKGYLFAASSRVCNTQIPQFYDIWTDGVAALLPTQLRGSKISLKIASLL